MTGRVSDGFLFGALAFCIAAIANDGHLVFLGSTVPGFYTSQLLVRIGFGVIGLLTIENLWRNTEPQRRWQVWPLCLALGGLFAYELFLFSEAFITRGRVDRGLGLGRAIAAAFMAPLLALAMARNREWRVDIHVSRQVVFHTATLLASGCFLLAVAIVGMVLRKFEGACPPAGDVVRRHCRPRDRTLFREPAAGRQAASYLAEERSTKVLRDSELLNEYSKRFAFVVHDTKNLASQLGLAVSNARRYIDDPNFQRDMLQTIEGAAQHRKNGGH